MLAQENEERRKLAEAQALAGELRVLTQPLSYAKAQELVQIITNSALSSRGEVQVDARTNTLIIRDLSDRLTAAAELITTLDRPQPQVEIEARIVQTSRDFARSLGVSCTHCHNPAAWDSDEKDAKHVARAMQGLARSIRDQLKTIEKIGNENPAVNCTTCHKLENVGGEVLCTVE